MKRGTLWVLSLSVAIPSSSQTLLIPAIPALVDERGFSVVVNSWLLSAFLIGACLSAPLVGRIGDLRGRRLLTVLTSAAYVIGCLICLAGGDSGLAMIIGRAFQGFSAGVFVLHLSAIQQLVASAPSRAGHIGVLSGVVAMGPAIGFLVGGTVTAHWGVSIIFVIGGIVGTLSTTLLWFWAPSSGGTAQGSVDVCGAALVALSLVAFLAFIGEVGASGPLGPTTLLVLGGAVAAVGVTVAWMRRATAPFIDLVVLRNRVGALGNAATVWGSAAMFGLFVVVPQLVQDGSAAGLGLGPVAAGLVLAPGAIAMVLVGPLAARVGASRGYGRVIMAGNTLCAVGLLALAILPPAIVVVVLLATITGLGIGVAFPAMPSVVMDAAPREAVGVAAGINSLSRGIGSAVGGQVTLMISVAGPVSWGSGHQAAFVASAACALVAVAMGGRIRAR